MKSGAREAFASVIPPVFRRPRWQLPLYLFPFDVQDSRKMLAGEAELWRRKNGLQPLSTVD